MKTIAAILGLVAACHKDATSPALITAVNINLPALSTLPVGDSVRLAATATDERYDVLPGLAFTWSSSDPTVATVQAVGTGANAVVAALKPGNVILTAVTDTKSGTTSLTVIEPVASIAVSLSVSTLVVGDPNAYLTVVLRDASDNVVLRRPVLFESSNSLVARVSALGIVTAVGPGTASITATSDGLSAVATVNVIAPPPPHAFVWTAAGGFVDLGTLSGFASSRALAINAVGQVVGSSSDAGANPRTHAVLWSPAGVAQDLGTLPGFAYSEATAINNLGEVVGVASTSAYFTGIVHAVRWSATGVIRDLGTLPGDAYSTATGINDAGQVVGQSSPGQGAGHVRAFIWTEAGGMAALLRPANPTYASANAINRTGAVAGETLGAGDVAGEMLGRAFRLGAAGAFQALAPLPGDSTAAATAINDAGDVVGTSDNYCNYDPEFDTEDVVVHAVLWTAAGGTVNLTSASAYGLNNRGQVVGGASGLAFVWSQAAGVTYMGVLPFCRWSEARGVNDAGQVVGSSGWSN